MKIENVSIIPDLGIQVVISLRVYMGAQNYKKEQPDVDSPRWRNMAKRILSEVCENTELDTKDFTFSEINVGMEDVRFYETRQEFQFSFKKQSAARSGENKCQEK
jgi:hypothetical protein